MTPREHDELVQLGMTLVPEFITAAEELDLLPKLIVPAPSIAHAHPGRNRVQRYGAKKPYNNYIISAVIPAHFAVLGERLVAQKLLTNNPDSVTINEYLTGDIIQAHVDAAGAGPVITVLSLGGPATMVLKRQEKSYTVALPPRSLIQMRNELRHKWTHEILPVTAKRYSVVFRCSQECPGEET